MKHLKYCSVYPTPERNWSGFEAVDSSALSDFQSWALMEAFWHIGLKKTQDQNGWCWSDGCLEQYFVKDNKTTDKYILGMTANGILFVKHYTPDANGEMQ